MQFCMRGVDYLVMEENSLCRRNLVVVAKYKKMQKSIDRMLFCIGKNKLKVTLPHDLIDHDACGHRSV